VEIGGGRNKEGRGLKAHIVMVAMGRNAVLVGHVFLKMAPRLLDVCVRHGGRRAADSQAGFVREKRTRKLAPRAPAAGYASIAPTQPVDVSAQHSVPKQ